MLKFYLLIVAIFLLPGVSFENARAQSVPAGPSGAGGKSPEAADAPGLLQLRFITDNDYPPFNYLDQNGNLVGFNVELAKAICAELQVRCSVQALAWDRMITAIENNTADAIIASLAITRKNRRRVAFSHRYYQTPARFIVRKSESFKQITPEILSGKHIGVVRNTSHEAYLKAFFNSAKIISFKTSKAARQALSTGRVDALFGDGVSLMFWIKGSASNNCCTYAGGPFTESRFFGEGVGIAVKKNNTQMLKVINNGLDRVRISGKFQQLFSKYFPMAFY